MRILVLGAGGMAGHVIALHFLERGHHVAGLARRQLGFCPTIVADARDEESVRSAVRADSYDAVVNCVGVLNQAVDAHPADGIYLNACLPHRLAEYAKGVAGKVVHLSTDCVFSGHGDGGYREDSRPDADSMYGRSKALGELRVGGNLTFRTSIVGPDLNRNGAGLFNWFMKQRGKVSGFAGAIWTGVCTPVLARAVEAAVEQDLSGLYHLVNNERINKFELLKLFNLVRPSPVEIIETNEFKVEKSLVNNRDDFTFSIPSYPEMVRAMAAWMERHKIYYPHYLG